MHLGFALPDTRQESRVKVGQEINIEYTIRHANCEHIYDLIQLDYTRCTSEIVMEDHGSALYGLLNDNFPLQTHGFPVPGSLHGV